MSEIDNIMGWMVKAFEQLEELREEMKQKLDENGRKLDLILKHLTGLNDDPN